MSRDAAIVILRDTNSDDAAYLCRGIESTLRRVGIPHAVLDEADADLSALKRFRIALLPCNPRLAPTTAKSLHDFMRRGGKLFLGLNPPTELLEWLGLKRLKAKPLVVNEMVFAHKTLHGLPPRAFLSTRQIALFKAETSVKALAQWYSLEDLTSSDPSVYLSPNGALLTTAVSTVGEHTQFSEDRVHLGRLIAALANHFLPGFDLLRFQRRLTEQLSEEEELVRHASPRDFEMRALWLPHVPTPNECVLSARQNFNLLCPNLGGVAAHHYERSTFRRPWSLADTLTKCVDQAHRSGLEVFPYVTAWPLPTEELKRFFDGTGRLLKHYPASQSEIPNLKSQIPVWMCPTNPDNQQLLLDAVTHLLDEFGLDGVALGGLRFPSEFSCVCDGCRSRFQEEIGQEIENWPKGVREWRVPWQTWRREVMTSLLKRLLTACRATNPNAKLAVATLPSWDRIPKEFGQDPAFWAQQRLADIFIPLNFTDRADALRSELNHQLASIAAGTRLCPALGVYSSTSEIPSAAELVRQVQTARDEDTDGFLLWHSHPALFQQQFAASLQAGALRSPAKLPWHANAPNRPRPGRVAKQARSPRHHMLQPIAEC